MQSHTPFKALVEGSGDHDALKDKTILVTGGRGDQCREVAAKYAHLINRLCCTMSDGPLQIRIQKRCHTRRPPHG